jgi:D-sedoheptulose 7-phosphate isomerase
MPAMALTTNSSILTALGNDYGLERVFARQVEALVAKQDVVVGICTSGCSASVLEAMRAARQKGACCVGWMGANGAVLSEICDLCLLVPSIDKARIREMHITIEHILSDLLEEQWAESNSE